MLGTGSYHWLKDCSFLLFPNMWVFGLHNQNMWELHTRRGTVVGVEEANFNSCQALCALDLTRLVYWVPSIAANMGDGVKECQVLLICEGHIGWLGLGMGGSRKVFFKCCHFNKMKSWKKYESFAVQILLCCSYPREDFQKLPRTMFSLSKGLWSALSTKVLSSS